MTHDELLATIRHRKTTSLLYTKELNMSAKSYLDAHLDALRAVVELHKPFGNAVIWCDQCSCLESEGEIVFYPCPTIQAIEKELN